MIKEYRNIWKKVSKLKKRDKIRYFHTKWDFFHIFQYNFQKKSLHQRYQGIKLPALLTQFSPFYDNFWKFWHPIPSLKCNGFFITYCCLNIVTIIHSCIHLWIKGLMEFAENSKKALEALEKRKDAEDNDDKQVIYYIELTQ